MLRSDLCDYSDAYVVVNGDITLTRPDNTGVYDKKLASKNNAPFISCIQKLIMHLLIMQKIYTL